DRGHRAGGDRRDPAARRPPPHHGVALRLRVRPARDLRDRPSPGARGGVPHQAVGAVRPRLVHLVRPVPASAHHRARHRLTSRSGASYPRGMDEDVSAYASTFDRFLHAMSAAAATGQEAPVRDLLDQHLGDRSEVLPVVAEGYATYDHVNLQVALDAYVAAVGRTAELIGLSGQQRRWM